MSDFPEIKVEISKDEKELLVGSLLRSILQPASLSILTDENKLSFKNKVYDALVNEGILRLLQKEVERMDISEKV